MEADALEALREQLTAAGAIAATLISPGWEDRWCASTLRGASPAGRLPIELLAAGARSGCSVEVEVGHEGWSLRAAPIGTDGWTVISSGPWEDVVADEGAVAAGEQAVAAADLPTALALVPELAAAVVVRVRVGVEQLAWVRTAEVLTDEASAAWDDLARVLATIPDGHGHLVIASIAGSDEVRAPGLVVHGPEVWPATAGTTRLLGRAPTDRVVAAGLALAPDAVLPTTPPPTALADVDTTLRQVAGAMAWWWAAGTTDPVDGRPRVAIESGRVLAGPLPACPPERAAAAVGLWVWGFADDRPGRREAVLRAAALQADTVPELYELAPRILQTATFLSGVAESGVVQEALAARRDARSAALSAAQEAADRARASARATVDRVVVVIGGGIGIVLANRAAVVDDEVAYGLLALVAALAVGAVVLALRIDLPSARRGLRTFRAELEAYEEVLTAEDIGRIALTPSLRDADDEVDRARGVVLVLVAVLTVAALVLGGLVTTSDGPPPSSTSTTTTTPTTSSTTAPPTTTSTSSTSSTTEPPTTTTTTAPPTTTSTSTTTTTTP